jgi:hypothetical protein
MARVTVTLHTNEKSALCKMAQDQRRDPRAQAALLIRNGLERSGYLSEPITELEETRRDVRQC